MDADCSDIEISVSQGFGSELWEEERIRCERQGLKAEEQPTPPSTATNHRTKTIAERNYSLRLRNLMEKGLALIDANRLIQQAASPNIYTYLSPEKDSEEAKPLMTQLGQVIAQSPAVLSRRNTLNSTSPPNNDDDDMNRNNNSNKNNPNIYDSFSSVDFPAMSPQPYGVSSPAPDRGMGTNYGSALSAAALLSPAALSRHTPDSNVFKWVLGTIKKTEDKLVRSSQLFERMLAEDPEQMADEYMIRSQASDEQQKKLTSSSDFHDEDSRLVGESLIADGQGQGQEIDDQEDVLTAEEIKLERENIMQSTQAEKANMKADADIGCSNNDLKVLVNEESFTIKNSSILSSSIFLEDDRYLSRVDSHVERSKVDSEVHLSKPPLPRPRSQPVQPPLKATSTQGGSFAPGLSNNPNLSQHLRLDKRNPTLTLGSLFNPNRKRTNVSYTNSEANEPVLPSVPQSSNNPAVKESFSLLYDSPIGIASVNEDNRQLDSSRSRKRLRRTVSFLDQSPLVSSNPASLDPSPQGRADSLTWLVESPLQMAPREKWAPVISGSLTLQPTFDAPRGCDLTPMHFYGLPDVVNPPVVYSDLKDFQQAQNPNHLIGNFLRNRHIIKFKYEFESFDGGFPTLKEDQDDFSAGNSGQRWLPASRVRCLVPSFSPPLPSVVRQSLSEADTNQVSSSATKSPLTTQQKYARSSQIHSPTQTQVRLGASRRLPEQDLIGSGNLTAKKSRTSVMSVEVLCEARQGFLPNPKLDCVKAVFWIVDDTVSDSESEATRRYEGAVFLDPQVMRDKGLAACMMKYRACGLPQLADIQVAFSEMNLFERFVAVMNEVDPDFVVGYEVHRESVGYLVRRGKVINIDMLQLLSKMPKEPPSFRNNQSGGSFEGEIKEDDAVVSVDQPTLFITGRVLLDLWNLMRSELKLTSYTYGNVAVHLLGETVPYFSPWQLSRWFQSLSSAHRAVRHMRKLAELNLLILKKTDLIRKTAECAR